MFHITSYMAALQMPGSEDIMEIPVAAETEAEVREMIADNFPDEIQILLIIPIVDSLRLN